ncbi:Do family serine endopeptidase [Oricola thermophila]|uniref:Do family serine endopeptidase n=1 Tax=Oricola thermophila TaxID=2742145 RepID=A0A6N1VCG1_9HYPH|nr:Do family serine endopeptidase [Oricola thermophila]QKV18213.1 Do family serine endopeptidase [Oricola thermophila]
MMALFKACRVALLSILVVATGVPPALAQEGGQSAGEILLDLFAGRDRQDNAGAERRVPLSRDEMQLSFAPLVKATAPAVVNVYAARLVQQRSPFAGDPFFEFFFGPGFSGPTRPRMEQSLGSGVIVDPSGLIVTNNHVIGDADEIKVALSDGEEFESTVVLRDERADLAVLQIDAGRDLDYLEIADSDAVEIGDLVLAIGNPFGVGQTVTSGIVSALARNRVGVSDFGFFIQTDAAINPGNSGGALISMSGKLIGINTAIVSRSGGSIGIGFAIPSNMVRAVIDQARGGADAFERPYIGARFDTVTPAIAESLGMRRPSGAIVTEVDRGSPADRAGIRPGDVVLSMDGHPIEHPDALEYRLETAGPGRTVTFAMLSRGQRVAVDLTLEQVPETVPANETQIAGTSPLSGATVANISPRVLDRLNVRFRGEGVIVTDVRRGSTADRIGFKRGDVLIAINGLQIDTVDTVAEIAASTDRSWSFVINRDGRIIRQFFRG